jgi:hypothetical protein
MAAKSRWHVCQTDTGGAADGSYPACCCCGPQQQCSRCMSGFHARGCCFQRQQSRRAVQWQLMGGLRTVGLAAGLLL